MRKLIIIAASFAALAVPSAALAAQPTGDFVTNDGAAASTMTLQQWLDSGMGSEVGYYSSRATQNGEFIGGNKFGQAGLGYDNTSAAGSRSAIVQATLGHDGTGKPAK
jgi:hypothetical protein